VSRCVAAGCSAELPDGTYLCGPHQAERDERVAKMLAVIVVRNELQIQRRRKAGA